MSSSQSSRSGNDAGSTGKIMLRTLGCFYVEAGQKVETRLRKQNAPQEGGSLRRPGANLNVSASFRAYPFLSERHKRDSLQSGERFARDVVRRRCLRTTHDMDDLRGQGQDELASRPATAALNVRTAIHVHPRPVGGFTGGRHKTTRREWVFSTSVRASTPILYCSDSRQERESEHNLFSIDRMRNQGGRLDGATGEKFTVQRFSPVHSGNRRLDEGGHISGEVTL